MINPPDPRWPALCRWPSPYSPEMATLALVSGSASIAVDGASSSPTAAPAISGTSLSRARLTFGPYEDQAAGRISGRLSRPPHQLRRVFSFRCTSSSAASSIVNANQAALAALFIVAATAIASARQIASDGAAPPGAARRRRTRRSRQGASTPSMRAAVSPPISPTTSDDLLTAVSAMRSLLMAGSTLQRLQTQGVPARFETRPLGRTPHPAAARSVLRQCRPSSLI